MAARLIDGKGLARALDAWIRTEIAALKPMTVTLAAVEIDGAPSAGGIEVYAASQRKCAENLGIAFRRVTLPRNSKETALADALGSLNRDREVHGILLLRPLPEEIDDVNAASLVAPEKDVEGMHPANLGTLLYGSPGPIPCTARAALACLKSTGIDPRGLETVVVSHSPVVGKPIALMMMNDLSTVTTCHIATKDLKSHTLRADILFAAAGSPGLITGDMVKPGAVVIDIGINRVVPGKNGGKGKVVGDVDFDSVSPVAGWITPVPGGVGPVTTAVLMENTVRAALFATGSQNENFEPL